jgi:hypothetical protein
MLGIDRRTVQRYARKFPEVLVGQKVDVDYLGLVIQISKESEGRGFPLRKARGRRLPLSNLAKKPPAVIRRTFEQRMVIIHREIDAMTDDEQQVLLPFLILSLFRPQNVGKAFAKAKAPNPEEA